MLLLIRWVWEFYLFDSLFISNFLFVKAKYKYKVNINLFVPFLFLKCNHGRQET